MFAIAKILGGRQNVAETLELPCTSGQTYTFGEALVLSAGKLTKASGDVAVQYVALESYQAPASGARKLRCFRVMPDQLFEVEVSAAPTSLAVGDKVTIATDGLAVTATKASNYGAEIVDLCEATKAGHRIQVVLR